MTEEQIIVLLNDLETVQTVGDRIEPDDMNHAMKQAQIDILKWILQ